MFADLIKSRREALDLSQAELASRAHTSQATISRIEAGEFYPRARLARDIALALELIPTEVLMLIADTAPLRAS